MRRRRVFADILRESECNEELGAFELIAQKIDVFLKQ